MCSSFLNKRTVLSRHIFWALKTWLSNVTNCSWFIFETEANWVRPKKNCKSFGAIWVQKWCCCYVCMYVVPQHLWSSSTVILGWIRSFHEKNIGNQIRTIFQLLTEAKSIKTKYLLWRSSQLTRKCGLLRFSFQV